MRKGRGRGGRRGEGDFPLQNSMFGKFLS